MNRMLAARTVGGLLLTLAAGACGGAARAPQDDVQPAAPVTRASHTAADVQFMADMIRHHAQAVLIAGWAPSHGAGRAVRVLSERIVVGQQDEIALMARWLRERGETVPRTDSSYPGGHGTDHSGTAHSAAMPGMLTAEQLAQLDRARGPEFDRLFLTFMITHHQGALTMVDRLFATPGAAQDQSVYRLASGVHAEQLAEIDRMRKLLADLGTDVQTSPPPR